MCRATCTFGKPCNILQQAASRNIAWYRLMDDNILFGYQLPMPRVDLYIALATVSLFLPAVVVVHHIVAFVIRRVQRLRPAARKQD